MSTRVTAVAFALPFMVLCQHGNGTTWNLMDTKGLVGQADVIVVGKIVRAVRVGEEGKGESIGVIEVAETLVGPAGLRNLWLVLDTGMHGLVYEVGDQGMWFLRRRPGGGRTQLPVQQRAGEPRLRRREGPADFPSTVFVADHPQTFWTNDAAFHKRKPGAQRLPEAGSPERRRLDDYLRQRVRADVEALEADLGAAKAALARLEGQKPGDSPAAAGAGSTGGPQTRPAGHEAQAEREKR